jgi:hypothetical protein
MKTAIKNSVRALIFSLVTATFVNAQAAIPRPSDNNVPPHLNLSITIPDALQSQIVRQDFENEAIFSLKNGNASSFLFSVTKVSYDQWEQLKNQLKDYTVLENKDGFITYTQKTDVKKIKGTADVQYQQAMQQVDGIISTIKLN